MKAFVTGSTGLLGSNLVNRLLEQGYEVKALARSPEKAHKLLNHPHVEIVVGDMENIPAFAPAMAGCDVLFHTAAYFRDYYQAGDHWPKLERINIQGTIALFDEAERYDIKKVIYTSSSGVLGLGRAHDPVDENTPPDQSTFKNLYFKSKVLAEQAIAEFLKTHRLPVVLILPGAILGPQDAAPTTSGQAIVNILNGKVPFLPPGGMVMVDARDVAQAMVNAVERGQSGERYVVSNRYMSIAELARCIEKISGIAAPRAIMPYPVILSFAWFSELASRLTGREPILSVNSLQGMQKRHTISATKAVRELGATFRPLENTIRDEVNWFIANGYVQRAIQRVQPA
jgi:dihydroflavonol-4-reductase